ncbi:MAG: sulfatase-like hydrolase/transferase [Planctomycetota bacterium]|jgi:arylsulfatase A-like enzyme
MSEQTTRREFLKTAGLAAASAGVFSLLPGCATEGPVETTKTKKPNILLILADDLGWADVGFHGSNIMTPNLDRLAAEGVQLQQHYVQPMCTPTRVALLTGRYPSRFGDHAIKPCNTQVLEFGTPTLASELSSVGYDTGITGKWHLGSKPEWGPLKFGFNHSYGSLAGGVGQYNHLYKKGPYSRTWHRNDQLVDEEGHSTDLIAREAVRWIEAKREPFFIYVAFTAVHVPVEVPQQYMELYKGKEFYDDPAKDESFKFYAAYASHMDDTIGKMVEALNRTGQRGNTLIIFASDNGAIPRWRPRGSYPGTYKACPVMGSNLPFRGLKAQLYEGGIRVPTIVNRPGKLAPRKVDSPVHVVDWMPTLTRLAGYKPKQDLKWDGRNIWPLLTGEVTQPEPRTLYWKFTRGRSAVRHGDWKLIVDGKEKSVELYNLAEDPYEKHDLASERPEQVDKLEALLAEQRKLDKQKT